MIMLTQNSGFGKRHDVRLRIEQCSGCKRKAIPPSGEIVGFFPKSVDFFSMSHPGRTVPGWK